MKTPRFIIEYANYRIKELEKLKKDFPENEQIYNETFRVIDRAVSCLGRGMITVDECVKAILTA